MLVRGWVVCAGGGRGFGSGFLWSSGFMLITGLVFGAKYRRGIFSQLGAPVSFL